MVEEANCVTNKFRIHKLNVFKTHVLRIYCICVVLQKLQKFMMKNVFHTEFKFSNLITASNIVHFYNDKLMHQVRIWLVLILFSYSLSCLFDSSFLRLKKTQTVFLFSPMIHKRRTCFSLILDLTIIKSNWIHYLFNCSNININSNNKRISSMFSFSGEKWFEINFNY